MTTFLIGFMPWLCSRIAHTRRTSRNTYQNSRDVFSSILIHLYRTKTRLYFHQKIATIALGGGDVDRAASRVVDEVAATEMARVIVGLWNVHLNICQKKNQSFAVLLFSPLPGPFSVRRFCHLWICDAGCIVRDISGAQPCQRTEFQPCNSATSCGLHVMIGCSAPTGALACIIFDHYPSQAGTVIITYDID
jgi:hypothetical protein